MVGLPDHLHAQETQQSECYPRRIRLHKIHEKRSRIVADDRHAHMEAAEDASHEQSPRMPLFMQQALNGRNGTTIHRQTDSHYDDVNPVH